MKRLALTAVAVFALAGFLTATATSENNNSTPKSNAAPKPVPARCTVQAFRPLSKAIWRLRAWRRGNPPEKVIRAVRRRLRCAEGHGDHHVAMVRTWKRDRAAYFEHRRKMLWLEEFKPFVYPSGKRWSVPYPIALCESGENYFVGPSGAYGLIPPFPQWLPPRRQDEIAHRLYEEQGEGPWAPYESGCAYR